MHCALRATRINYRCEMAFSYCYEIHSEIHSGKIYTVDSTAAQQTVQDRHRCSDRAQRSLGPASPFYLPGLTSAACPLSAKPCVRCQ